MSLIAILVAIGLAFLAFRFLAGMVKFGIIAIIVIVIFYFLSKSGGLVG